MENNPDIVKNVVILTVGLFYSLNVSAYGLWVCTHIPKTWAKSTWPLLFVTASMFFLFLANLAFYDFNYERVTLKFLILTALLASFIIRHRSIGYFAMASLTDVQKLREETERLINK